jgi:hypothetical protein
MLEEAREMSKISTPEQAREYFDKKVKAEWRKLKRAPPLKEIDIRELKDPYYQMLKRDKPIESRYTNYFDISDQDYHKYFADLEKNIGRYPIGFRQYENFENYKIANPNASIGDYTEDSKSN